MYLVRPPSRSIWISLAVGRFGPKTPDYEGWICLDFLGFSRPNRALSMSYTGKTAEIFSLAFLLGVSRAAGRTLVFSGANPGSFMRQAYLAF